MSGLLDRILLKRASGDGLAVDKLGVTLTGTKVRQQNIKPFLLIFLEFNYFLIIWYIVSINING